MNAIVAAPGARLRGERERQGLSVQKAADEMRLDAWVIEALETDQYERVGPAVYVRGHLKKYASILAIPGDEIVAGYESLRAATPDAPPKAPAVRVMSSPPLVHNLTRGQIVAAGFLLLLVTGVLLWKPWQQRAAAVAPSHASEAQAGIAEGTAGDGQAQQAPPAGGGDAAAVQGAGAEPQPADRTAFGPGESSPPQGSAAPTAAATGAVATGAAAAAAVAAGGPPTGAPTGAAPPPKGGSSAIPTPASAGDGAGRANLRLSFSADSWVDVRDASGRQIFSGNGRANSVKTIAGAAPLRVYLGFASGVQLEINQHAIAIARPFLHGDVARFQAGADGVLRPYSNSVRPRG